MFKKTIEWLYLRMNNNLVYLDPLTAVYNRHYYQRELIKKTLNEEMIVVLLDLNGLKKINDTIGHSAGDKLLINVASSLKNFGTVCRMGGDEFLLLMDEKRLDQFEKYAHEKKEFCYSYLKKEKGVDLREAIEQVDKELVEIKNEYRKTHARGGCPAKNNDNNNENKGS